MDCKSGLVKHRREIRLAVQCEPASVVRPILGRSLETFAVTFRDAQVQPATGADGAGELRQNCWHHRARDVQQRRVAPDGVSRPGAQGKLPHVGLEDTRHAVGAQLAKRTVDADDTEASCPQERDVTSGSAAGVDYQTARRKADGKAADVIREVRPGGRILPGVLGGYQVIGLLGLANWIRCTRWIGLHIDSA